MQVDFLDKMGSDLTVANAARVSFNKESVWDIEGYDEEINIHSRSIEYIPKKTLKVGDKKIINFLARENHWTPFGHCSLQFRIKAPIFVARQLGKHQIGLVWNEISRRYVDSDPEFYFPEKWRKKNPDKKQGSYENEFVDLTFSRDCQPEAVVNMCRELYHAMIDADVCAEQARMILPQNMYTEWYWSGSLFAFARVCNLRLKKDTQKETRDIAEMIAVHAAQHFPVSWNALTAQVDKDLK